MRKTLIALALAGTALAAPAQATTDNSGYLGLEVGLTFPDNLEFDNFCEGFGCELDYKTGWDADVLLGYDFGSWKAELELGYKKARHDQINGDGGGVFPDYSFDADGSTRMWSGMINVLWNPGLRNGWDFYIGPGIGIAKSRFRLFGDSDHATSIAWQGIIGIGWHVGTQVDLGLKYRTSRPSRIGTCSAPTSTTIRTGRTACWRA